MNNCKVITIANHKGGVGKTTSAILIADELKRIGKSVLLIDIDAQCNATSIFKGVMDGEYTMFDIMNKSCTGKDAVQHTEVGDIIPGDKMLVNKEGYYSGDSDGFFRLKDALEDIKDNYEYIIIDTPSNLGTYVTNSIIASDYVIIPIMSQKFALDGLGDMISAILQIKKHYNNSLEILGILLIGYHVTKSLDRKIKELLPIVAEQYKLNIFNSVVRICQQIQDSQAEGVTINAYNSKCHAAKDYEDVVLEIIERTGN